VPRKPIIVPEPPADFVPAPVYNPNLRFLQGLLSHEADLRSKFNDQERSDSRMVAGKLRRIATAPRFETVTGAEGNHGFESKMSAMEACSILGIRASDGSDPKKVQAAHRKVILRNHPDRGGSPYIATKINQAKERLSKLGPEELAQATEQSQAQAQAQTQEQPPEEDAEGKSEKEEGGTRG